VSALQDKNTRSVILPAGLLPAKLLKMTWFR
jgi:hypothetical protein